MLGTEAGTRRDVRGGGMSRPGAGNVPKRSFHRCDGCGETLKHVKIHRGGKTYCSTQCVDDATFGPSGIYHGIRGPRD